MDGYKIKKGQKLSETQVEELKHLQDIPIVYDEDSPELTETMEKSFLCAARQRDRRKA